MDIVYSHSPLEYGKYKQAFRDEFDAFHKRNKSFSMKLTEIFNEYGINVDLNIVRSLMLPDDFKRYDYNCK